MQIEKTADSLSKELLYMKFLQGIPIVGALGGASDLIYLQRITEYANIKYKKRFLMKKKRMMKSKQKTSRKQRAKQKRKARQKPEKV